jgi:hypothetical protein
MGLYELNAGVVFSPLWDDPKGAPEVLRVRRGLVVAFGAT